MNYELMDGFSMNIEADNMDKLRAVFPECFAEGKLDIDKLLSLCGEYIDNDFEKYKFEWKGKAECLKLAQKRSTGTLRPCPEESVNWDSTQNLYIEGDNLEVLKLLQTAYYRKVKMIYIDPPYNTGNDFVYADDFADPMARYKEVTQQTTKSNPETMGRFHTNWLNMMYPRLRLAANLLRDDGVIFISIDDHEVTNLRKLCDEVFGEENFVAELIWERAFSPKNDAKYISNSHDYVLMYAKAIESFKIGRLARTEEANARYSNPDNDPRGLWMSSDISVKTYNAECDYPITTPSGRVIEPPTGRCWRLSKNAFLERLQDNRIWFGPDGNGVPRIKRFLSELKYEGMAPTSIMPFKDVGHSQEGAQEVSKLLDAGVFSGPKPVRLLRRLLTLANTDANNNDIILDFFSGSATTAHAVMQLNAEDGGNRRFILVQLPEVCDENSEAFKAGYKNICEIGKERIRRAGNSIHNSQCIIHNEKDGQQTLENNYELSIMNCELDTGFRVFKLDTSNLKTWDSTPIEDEQLEMLYDRMNGMIHRVKSDRSDMDMVSEIMLKLGVPLTYPVRKITLNAQRETIHNSQHETIHNSQFIIHNEEEGRPSLNNNYELCIMNSTLKKNSALKTVYAVGDDCLLLICLAENVQPADVDAMAEYAPAKLIISRDSFTDDTAMANAYYILRDKGIDLKLV